MSSFFECFSTPLSNINTKQHFIGKHGISSPTALTQPWALSENDAEMAVIDSLDGVSSYKARYLPYFEDGKAFTNAKIVRLERQIKTAETRRRELQLAGLEKALTYTTKTCPCCQQKIYTERFAKTLASLKNMPVNHGISFKVCDKSRSGGDNPFPYSKRDHASMQKLTAQANVWYENIAEEQRRLATLAYNKGKASVNAMVGVYLHESLYAEYDDEH